jgi:E3 SUMO-protein ligase NSE2
MPVASSSRRKGAVRAKIQPSLEDIEEDNRTQRDDPVDDEDEAPFHLGKREKKEKKPTLTKGKGRASENAMEEDDEGEDDGMDYENLPMAPLSKADAVKLGGYAADWRQIRDTIHQQTFTKLRDMAIAMAETAEGEAEEVIILARCFTIVVYVGQLRGFPNLMPL